jgi:hypothetical protein
MTWKSVLPIAALLLCAAPSGFAQDIVSAQQLTKDQFMALPPEAVIDFGGKRMTKRAFLIERARALEQANKTLQDTRAHAKQEFAARRKAFLAAEQAQLKAANLKVQAEINGLLAADAAAHGPNWEARKKQAAALLKQAASAQFLRRQQLEKRAAELLATPNR